MDVKRALRGVGRGLFVGGMTLGGPVGAEPPTARPPTGECPIGQPSIGQPSKGAPGPRLVEVDADTPGIDREEFVEIDLGGTPPAGLVLVVYDGGATNDPAVTAVPLDALGPGLGTVGSAEVPGVDLVAWTTNGLQNGPDAVALFRAVGIAPGSFVDTAAADPPTGAVLLDALVYGTGDATDEALLAALAPGAAQWDEASGGPSTDRSLQRVAGGWVSAAPTPDIPNAWEGGQRSIAEVQGATHRSPYEGAWVCGLRGCVTSIDGATFTLESVPAADRDEATSEAIEVYVQSGAPVLGSLALAVGDGVRVDGLVQEWKPAGGAGLSVTRLAATSIHADVPPAELPLTRIGREGRQPPTEIIDDDSSSDVQRGGGAARRARLFEPGSDGLDFWESLEWMRVGVRGARVVGPSAGFAAPVVVVDGGVDATGLSERGALVWTPTDAGPERLPLGSRFDHWSEVDVGDFFAGELTGILSYAGEIHRLDAFEYPSVLDGGLEPVALAPATDGWSVATLNVRNLSALTPLPVFLDLATTIVHGLGAPDLIALAEIQDGSGSLDDGMVDAAETWSRLVAAIATVGAIDYAWTDIAPLDGADGGQPGGNIRVGYLWRADGPLEIVTRPGGDATTSVKIESGPSGPYLDPSPGRIEPQHAAFADSRKPLAAEFTLGGQPLFVVANHFVAKGADDPSFGHVQPPMLVSSLQRGQQAEVVAQFAAKLLSADPTAALIVLGDFNDTQPSRALLAMEAGPLSNLTASLDPLERATFLYRGSAQALDHIFVSPVLSHGARLEVARLHAEFHQAPTDHDAVRATLAWPQDAGR